MLKKMMEKLNSGPSIKTKLIRNKINLKRKWKKNESRKKRRRDRKRSI
jgi:hypothetical protein